MQLIKVGDIFDQSKVIRIDRGLGLLLEIPSSPVPTPTYVNVRIFLVCEVFGPYYLGIVTNIYLLAI